MKLTNELGKKVVDDVYVHLSAIGQAFLPDQCQEICGLRGSLPRSDGLDPNVVKLNVRDGRLSLLCYPDFDTAPFPQLAASWTRSVNGEVRYRTYSDSFNPPILHRKELLVPADWPGRNAWVETTSLAESLGLFDESHTIGFRENWYRLLLAKGYKVVDTALVPIGNDDEVGVSSAVAAPSNGVQRHLTALSRSSLSAPIQLLLRTGLLSPQVSIFDYGCGKGDDVRGLEAEGFTVAGWDPYYAPEHSRAAADIVNLGFVINVIEDAAERADALKGAASLAKRMLIVSVMLHNSSNGGLAFNDGVLSSRNTFQKYFSQDELRDYLEHALGLPVVMGGPGIALVFKDAEWEQRYLMDRVCKKDVASRLLTVAARIPRPPRPARQPRVRPPSRKQVEREELRPLISRLWETSLELGRWPHLEEVEDLLESAGTSASLTRALRIVQRTSDTRLLESASQSRRDDVLLFLAMQQFSKRPPYKRLDDRLQRDIKAFFGAYGAAYSEAARLLADCGNPQRLLEACKEAASRGLGHLDEEHSLQLHVSMVERLPVLLRAYVGCGMVLWDETSAVQMVKIHIASGKLTLLEFQDFDGNWLPRLLRRVKINLRRLNYSIFEYGTLANPPPLLYFKSRYINEEYPNYERQTAFDEALGCTGVLEASGEYGLAEADLTSALEVKRLQIGSQGLEASERIPDLDQPCGRHFVYRDFVVCGETQARLRIPNIPLRPATYNALHALATQILDPVIDYFGSIRLTYGFSSPELAKNIKQRIAPKLDQHACCEVTARGALFCERQGASCDFIVEDESMREVTEWIIDNLAFDRLYFYGDDRPLHVSFGPQNSRQAFVMQSGAKGKPLPRRFLSATKSTP